MFIFVLTDSWNPPEEEDGFSDRDSQDDEVKATYSLIQNGICLLAEMAASSDPDTSPERTGLVVFELAQRQRLRDQLLQPVRLRQPLPSSGYHSGRYWQKKSSGNRSDLRNSETASRRCSKVSPPHCPTTRSTSLRAQSLYARLSISDASFASLSSAQS